MQHARVHVAPASPSYTPANDSLGASDVARLTGWHPRQVRRVLASGALPTLPRTGDRGHWRVSLSAFRAYLKRTNKKSFSEDLRRSRCPQTGQTGQGLQLYK